MSIKKLLIGVLSIGFNTQLMAEQHDIISNSHQPTKFQHAIDRSVRQLPSYGDLTSKSDYSTFSSQSLTTNTEDRSLLSEVILDDSNFQACLNSEAQRYQWHYVDHVTGLNCKNQNIDHIDGVEVFSNLFYIHLDNNHLTHVNQLANLSQLEY